jgi:ribosomal protein L16 Arg81 hydroxylase
VESLFIKEPREQRGIHCRFGMRGVIAEGHFDSSRNMVALVSGTRRWILSHPRECHNSYLLPVKHPSGRHSEVDWSHPDLGKFPHFAEMQGSEVILTPGEVLYVPAWWLHYIVNLDTNCQCNSRSGDSYVGLADLHSCGFKINI